MSNLTEPGKSNVTCGVVIESSVDQYVFLFPSRRLCALKAGSFPRMLDAPHLARKAKLCENVDATSFPNARRDSPSASWISPRRSGGTFNRKLAPRPTDW